MSGSFEPGGIVMEFETGSPERFLQFDPSHLPHDQWLHRDSEFDPGLSPAEIADRYVLPDSDAYTVRIVEVPAGEQMQMGTLAGTDDHAGGADLVQLLSRDAIPDDWVLAEKPLEELLE